MQGFGECIMTSASLPSATVPPVKGPPVNGPSADGAPASLRERKKLATRRLLRKVALSLVAERGLANVTVEDIAEAAEVSPRTFFNYFPSKEAVLFGGEPDRAADLRERVAATAPGEPVLVALRAVLAEEAEAIARELRSLDGDMADWLRRLQVARTDPHVRAAQAARMEMMDRALADGLAARLGADQETDPYPGVLAAAAVATMRACLSFWAGTDGTVPLGELFGRAFQALEAGFPENAALRSMSSASRPQPCASPQPI
jgi:AcrR family transcriptional regulator